MISHLDDVQSLFFQVFPVSGGISDVRWNRSRRTWGGCILWTLSMCRRSSVPSACSDKPKQETMSLKDGLGGPENNPLKSQSRPTGGRKIGLMVGLWTCWLVGEVMGGLWGCLSWRGVMTCQVGRASGQAWPPSLWSSQITIPSQQQLRPWSIKHDLCLRWPKSGNAEAGATAGTSYGLPPVNRPARESNCITGWRAVIGDSAVSGRCSALNSGSPRCTLTCFFSLICEDYSGSVEEQEEGTFPVPSLCLLNPTMSLSRIHWTFIYNGTIWYYLILNLML